MGWSKKNGIYQIHRDPGCLVCYDADCVELVDVKASRWSNIGLTLGSAADALQATDANRPVHTRSDPDFAGHGSSTFSGAQYLRSGTWSATSTVMTYYVVGKFVQTGGVKVLLSSANSPNLIYFDANDTRININSGTLLSGAFAVGTCVLALVVNGASSSIYVNGTLKASGGAGTNVINGINIGANWYNSYPFIGKLSFICGLAEAHNADLISYNSRHLSNKYGIAI